MTPTPGRPGVVGVKLPPTLTVGQLAPLLGVHKITLYKAVRAGECPVPVLHFGRRVVFPTQPVIDLLGLAAELELPNVQQERTT